MHDLIGMNKRQQLRIWMTGFSHFCQFTGETKGILAYARVSAGNSKCR